MTRQRCPRCKTELVRAESPPGGRMADQGATDPAKAPFVPFCSERCKLLDLGAWLSGDFVIPGDRTDGPDAPPSEEDGDG